jgi:signal transduction histidine kinase
MSESAIAAYIRTQKQAISDDWERAVRSDLEELAHMDKGALLDHLPEVLDGLASWIEGSTDEADVAFAALADGHALQRLGFGIELAVVNIEYARLRQVLLRHLLDVPSSSDVREHLIRLDAGLDRAILMAVRRYTEQREYVRDRFISILGHDLRNPLGAVSMASESLLRSDAFGEREHKRVQTILRATERMSRIIRDVLDFASSHLGSGIPVTPVACDMGEIAMSVAEEIKSGHPDRDITVHTRGDLAGTFDADRVQQALGNLVGNAVRHGEDPILIEVCEADDRRAIFTRITSHGEPLAPELIPDLFEPFKRARHDQPGSLGLGLYIVAQIARAHGGTYDVTSSDENNAFTIRWPRTPLEEVERP